MKTLTSHIIYSFSTQCAWPVPVQGVSIRGRNGGKTNKSDSMDGSKW